MRAFGRLWSVSVVLGVLIACASPTAPPELANESAVLGESQANVQTSARKRDTDRVRWNIVTPAPEGMVKCIFVVRISRRAARKSTKGLLVFDLRASLGEAQTSKIGGIKLSAGFQPSPECDLFKGTSSVGITVQEFVEASGGGKRLRVRIKLHAHRGSNCSAPGDARGSFEVSLTSLGDVKLRDKDLEIISKGCS